MSHESHTLGKIPHTDIPGMEFEGPMGFFWEHGKVPMESLINAIAECWAELRRRGYPEQFIIAMIQNVYVGKQEEVEKSAEFARWLKERSPNQPQNTPE